MLLFAYKLKIKESAPLFIRSIISSLVGAMFCIVLSSCSALPFLSALGGGTSSSKSTDKSVKVDAKISGRDSVDKKSLISSDKNTSFSNKGDNTVNNKGVDGITLQKLMRENSWYEIVMFISMLIFIYFMSRHFWNIKRKELNLERKKLNVEVKKKKLENIQMQ